MQKKRLAIIGCKNMGTKHFTILRDYFADQVEVVGILNSSPESSRLKADELGVPFFNSLDEINKTNVDGVIVSTPAETHCSVAEPLLRKGIFCLIEKPMCSDLQECHRLLAAAAEGNTSMLIGHTENYNPAVRNLFKVLEAPIKSIHGLRASAGVNKERTTNVIPELMIHDLAIVNSLITSPLKKSSVCKKDGFNWTENATVKMEFENDVEVELEALIAAGRTERYMEIEDTKGNQYRLQFRERQLFKNGKLLPEGGDTLRFELENFINSLRGSEAPFVSGEEGMRNLEVCLHLEKQCRQSPRMFRSPQSGNTR